MAIDNDDPKASKKPAAAKKKSSNVEQITATKIFDDHANVVNGLVFSTDGQSLYSCGGNFTIQWDLSTLSERRRFTSVHWPFALSPTGRMAAYSTIEQENNLKLLDLTDERGNFSLAGHSHPHFPGISDLAFTADGRQLLSVGKNSSISLWDIENRQLIRNQACSNVSNAVFSSDSNTFLTCGEANSFHLWQRDNLQKIRQFKGHKQAVHSIAFLNDNQSVISASYDKTIRIWNLETGEETRAFKVKNNSSALIGMSLSPDSRYILCSRRELGDSETNLIQLLSLETEAEICALSGHSSYIYCARFSPDGKFAASGSGDHTMRFWKLPV